VALLSPARRPLPRCRARTGYAERVVPTERWLEYQRTRFRAWRSMGVAASVINFLLVPLAFWFDAQLFQSGAPLLQVRLMQGLHAYAGLFATVFLVYYGLTFRRDTPRRGDIAYFTLGVFSIIFVVAGIAAANQLGNGSIVIFAIGSVFALVVSFTHPAVFGAFELVAAALVVAAAATLQADAFVAASVQLNAIVIGLAASVVYVFYDRIRYTDFAQRHRLQELLRVRNTLFQALGHDLRTPLVQMRRVARILDNAAPVEPHRYELAHELDAVTHRYGLVLDNLMAIDTRDAADDRGSGGPASLRDIVERAWELNHQEATRKEVLLTHHLDDDVLVAVDRDTLVAVLNNLLSNAVKFTPSGGQVELLAEIDAERVALLVRDSGVGIDTAIRAQIGSGRPVVATTGTAGEGGLGIGLWVVRTLLASIGSELTIEPNTPTGTVARCDVPRYRR
jgi:signal transduction histidine kinase